MSLVEFPALKISHTTLAAIRTAYEALDAIDSQKIRTHSEDYLRTAVQYRGNASHAQQGLDSLAQSWLHQESPIVTLPAENFRCTEQNSVNLQALSYHLNHIATMGALAKHYAHDYINKLNGILSRLDHALAGERNVDVREQIIKNASAVAVTTERSLDQVAAIYQKSLLDTRPVSAVDDNSYPALGMNLEKIPPLFSGKHSPSPMDIDQGGFGDCYLMSTLGEISLFKPALIKKGIREDPQHPGDFIVSLFRDSNGNIVTQHVSHDELMCDLRNGDYASRTGQIALWPCVAETAYAKLRGDGDIDKGDKIITTGEYSNKIMENITGKPVTILANNPAMSNFATVKTSDDIMSEIARALKEHRLVTMGTGWDPTGQGRLNFESNGHTVQTGHLYMVLGVRGNQILVRNPYGHNDKQGATILVNPQDMFNYDTTFNVCQQRL